MSKETKLMAECLTEAVGLVILKPKSQATAGWMLCVCTIAVALYQERMRAQRDAARPLIIPYGEEVTTPDGEWRRPVVESVLPSTGVVPKVSPLVYRCPDCSQVWTEGHLCTAAGSRGTTWWPAP